MGRKHLPDPAGCATTQTHLQGFGDLDLHELRRRDGRPSHVADRLCHLSTARMKLRNGHMPTCQPNQRKCLTVPEIVRSGGTTEARGATQTMTTDGATTWCNQLPCGERGSSSHFSLACCMGKSITKILPYLHMRRLSCPAIPSVDYH